MSSLSSSSGEREMTGSEGKEISSGSNTGRTVEETRVIKCGKKREEKRDRNETQKRKKREERITNISNSQKE